LIKSTWKDKRRPVLINNWEATYFDFDDDKLSGSDLYFITENSGEKSFVVYGSIYGSSVGYIVGGVVFIVVGVILFVVGLVVFLVFSK